MPATKSCWSAAQAGTTGFYTAVYDILDGDEANPRIELFDNFGASVQALITGDVDMVLVDAASGRGYIGANPEALKIVGDALSCRRLRLHLHARLRAGRAHQRRDRQPCRRTAIWNYLNTKWFFQYDPSN